jgi:hypothetical protein
MVDQKRTPVDRTCRLHQAALGHRRGVRPIPVPSPMLLDCAIMRPVYANEACMASRIDYAQKGTEGRFWEKVDKSSECWIWTGSRSGRRPSQKYGYIRYDGKMKRATHVSWLLYTGSMPTKQILHKCDQPLCVRFDHLFEGTNWDNVLDKLAKGRQAKGITNGKAKLSIEDVILMRELHKEGLGYRRLAKMFATTRQNVSDIVNRRTWRHLNA